MKTYRHKFVRIIIIFILFNFYLFYSSLYFSPEIFAQKPSSSREECQKLYNKGHLEKGITVEECIKFLSRTPQGSLPLPLPANGATHKYSSGEGIAPLRIITRPGGYYFVKLVDWESNLPVMTFFIHSGKTVDVDVPLGSYKLKYAAGQSWYGEEDLFGLDTIYSQAEKKFVFKIDGNQISGYSVELILQPQGNLSTKRIAKSDF